MLSGLLYFNSLDQFTSKKRGVWLASIIVPRLFEEKWRDTVFGFPWGVVHGAWRVARGAWCVVPSF